ncbi:TadE/TadG family type IV pilus assembly protein [Micrococcus sp. 116]|uniref:TadE/TadG family type IV pilus assembly protein n=1 Tax=Micrococcus sp. 116 TaxID=2653154 RepID=UPI0012F22C04|nr:pilus assembly protein TadE [Micrococcus sp. 116]VWX45213.1 putative membrane protein [Micrococcus sp. 116]
MPTRNPWARRWRAEHGETPVSLIMVMPVIGMILLAIIAAGRVAEAQTAVESAVGAAVREVTLARDPGTGTAAAQSTVSRALSQRGVKCDPTVSVDAAALLNAPGVDGEASVRVQCQVPLADLLMPGLPGAVTIDREATSPVDTFRERA